MNLQYNQIISDLSRPLEPLPTSQNEVIKTITGIRAVFFDIYGTLFISGSGDVGTDGVSSGTSTIQNLSTPLEESIGKIFCELCYEAFDATKCDSGMFAMPGQSSEHDCVALGKKLMACYQQEILRVHAKKTQAGIDCPEVDIVEIWRTVAQSVLALPDDVISNLDVKRLAIEYEVRTNPVWPMPSAIDCIGRLASANLMLGIISNAQFYTPLLFPALMQRTLKELAFSPEMQYYSYQYGMAKPDEFLYRQALAGLEEKNIKPSEMLYVGNDMLNDIMPAARVGFQTALFAGDRRSLRPRVGDSRVAGVVPDIVVKDLTRLVDCVLDD